MGIFKALIRTTVNIVKLPVSLPLAAAKDVMDYALAEEGPESNLEKVVRELKEEADTED